MKTSKAPTTFPPLTPEEWAYWLGRMDADKVNQPNPDVLKDIATRIAALLPKE